jgi:hypothetical protein
MTEVEDLKAEERKKGIATTLQTLLAETIRLETEKLNTVKRAMRYLEEEKGNAEYTLEVANALKTQLELIGLLPATANKSKDGQEQREEEEGYEVEEKEG